MAKKKFQLPIESGPYFLLKDMIYHGVLPAGKRLIERELSELLGVSRIPLREALIRLQAEGLVHGGKRTGSYVIELTPKDIEEITSMRLLLEPAGARLATERMNAKLLASLRRICDEMGELAGADNLTKLTLTDYNFHWTLIQASGHSRLIRSFEICQIRILGAPNEYEILKTAAPDYAAREHRRLVDTIATGDPNLAEKAIYQHLMPKRNTVSSPHRSRS